MGARVTIRYFAWTGIAGSPDGDERQRILEVTKSDDGRKVERWTGKVVPNVAAAARLVEGWNRRFAFSPSFKGTEVS